MAISKSYFYHLCIVSITCSISSTLMHGASANDSWTKKLTPRVLKNKIKESIATKEYTLAPHATIDLTNSIGNITIKTWEQDKVILDAVRKGTEEEVAGTGISVSQKANTLTIMSKTKDNETPAQVDYMLMVPIESSIKISVGNGDIKIKQIRGSVQAIAEQGSIEIYDTVNTVIAKTNNGSIKVKQKTVAKPNTILLEALNGNVQLHLPKKLNADIQAKTFTGMVTSTMPVTLNPQTFILNKDTWNAMRKEVRGTFGDGGAPIIIDVSKGNIILEEY